MQQRKKTKQNKSQNEPQIDYLKNLFACADNSAYVTTAGLKMRCIYCALLKSESDFA